MGQMRLGSATTTDTEAGTQVGLAARPGAVGALADLPAYAPLYPGARVESSMAGSSTGEQGAQRGRMVALRIAETPDRVAAFCRARVDAANLPERSEAHINGRLMLTGSDGLEGGRSSQISIALDEAGSFVTIVYNNGGT